MAGRSSVHQAHEYAVESGWAETSSTFGTRIQTVGRVETSGLTRGLVDSERTVQRMQGGSIPIQTVFGGSFTTDIHLPGHGSTTAGAITIADHENFLGNVIGNVVSNGAGTTVAAGSTASSINTAAVSGLSAGGLVSIGVLGDAGAGGQWGVVSSHGSSVAALLTALPAAPANAAIIYSSVLIHPTETASSAAITSSRHRLLTADQGYACHGCFPQSIAISGLGNGGIPRASITWGVSRWDPVSATFPSATAADVFNPAPCAGGSLFEQIVGTVTRQTFAIRDFELNLDLNVIPIMGPGGVDAAQTIVGAIRGPQKVTFSFTVDAESATASPAWPAKIGTNRHVLYSWNGAATGRRGAFYAPNACVTDVHPVQSSVDGVNRERITMTAYTGTTLTSDLTASAYRIALG